MAEPDAAALTQHFLVEPIAPGPAGEAALRQLEQQVQATAGATARRSRAPRLRISVPSEHATRLRAAFADTLRFEPDAELRF